MEKLLAGAIAVFFGIAMMGALGILMAFPIMWTWNATMPEMFGLIKITWGQAWCLNFLTYSLIQSTSLNKE